MNQDRIHAEAQESEGADDLAYLTAEEAKARNIDGPSYNCAIDDFRAGLAQSPTPSGQGLREALISIRDMPEYDQDDAHRLREKARSALKSEKGKNES